MALFPAIVAMSFRAPPTPSEDRARATEDLIRDKGTDTSHNGDFFGLYTKSGQPKISLQQYQSLVKAARG